MSVFRAKAGPVEGQAQSQPAVTLPVFLTDADDFAVVSELASLEGASLKFYWSVQAPNMHTSSTPAPLSPHLALGLI